MPVTTTVLKFRHTMPLPAFMAVMTSLETLTDTVSESSTLSFNILDLQATAEQAMLGFAEYRQTLLNARASGPESSEEYPVFSDVIASNPFCMMTAAPKAVPFLKHLQKKAKSSSVKASEIPFRTLTAAEIYFWASHETSLCRSTWSGFPALLLQRACGMPVDPSKREENLKAVTDAVTEINAVTKGIASFSMLLELPAGPQAPIKITFRSEKPERQEPELEPPAAKAKRSPLELMTAMGMTPTSPVSTSATRPASLETAVEAGAATNAGTEQQAKPADARIPEILLGMVYLKSRSGRLHRLCRLIGSAAENERGERVIPYANLEAIGYEESRNLGRCGMGNQTLNVKKIAWSDAVPSGFRRDLRLCSASYTTAGLVVKLTPELRSFFDDMGKGVTAEKLRLTHGIAGEQSSYQELAAVDLALRLLDTKDSSSRRAETKTVVTDWKSVGSRLYSFDPAMSIDEQTSILLPELVRIINAKAPFFPWFIREEIMSRQLDSAQVKFELTPKNDSSANIPANKPVPAAPAPDKEAQSAVSAQREVSRTDGGINTQVREPESAESVQVSEPTHAAKPEGPETPTVQTCTPEPVRHKPEMKENTAMLTQTTAAVPAANPIAGWMQSGAEVKVKLEGCSIKVSVSLAELLQQVDPEVFMAAILRFNASLSDPGSFWETVLMADAVLRQERAAKGG